MRSSRINSFGVIFFFDLLRDVRVTDHFSVGVDDEVAFFKADDDFLLEMILSLQVALFEFVRAKLLAANLQRHWSCLTLTGMMLVRQC